ncbi:sialate O-acetylesterase [Geofilum sp. OHC36d9]|uniref:sialate O-acetylesterase n=1 Tax=Geofilum sp. OHC36d9 TaxID=3458413 RepID=UPI0040335C26
MAININAEIKLHGLFTDHMVLQQKSSVLIWGWATPGEAVSVTTDWNNKVVATKANANGQWQVKAKTIEAGGPYSILVKGDNEIKVSDVWLGEVWICSGQSNMHMPVGKFGKDGDWRTGVINYKNEIKNGDYPKIRMYTVERVTSETILDDVKGQWTVCSPETVGEFSAVGYFFGKNLYQELNVPIGLLNTSWGGTPAEAWTRKSVLTADKGFSQSVKRYVYNMENWDRVWSDYKEVLDSLDQLRASGKKVSNPRPPVGLGSNKAPYVLYNGMIAPLLNYRIKGVIWYQGENNAQLAWQYRRLFPAMIKNWRTDWKQGDFPFYFVQIAPHRSQNPEIREAQLMALRSVKNCGMVVTTDIGDSTNIHPTNKQEVGRRLSLWALAKTYNKKDIVYSGPIYRSMKIKENKIILSFDYVDGGLICKGDSLTHFTIAGADSVFYPAHAEIKGNVITVSAPEVKQPASVRFGWNYFPIHNLFNKSGLPASPFRTDDWPGATYGKN